MHILITLLILFLVVWIAFYLIDAVPVPAPFNMVLKAIIAILALAKVLAIAGIWF